MTNSFIHFRDSFLESVDIYFYKDGQASSTLSIDLDDVLPSIANSTNVFIMVPSQLFGFMNYENDLAYKGDVLKANVFSAMEDQIISDISTLEFFYHADLKLASWIDSKIFNSLIKIFNELDAEVMFLPEHFLLMNHGNAIYLKEQSFFSSFEDCTGFGGNASIVNDYISLLESNASNLSDLVLISENSKITVDYSKKLITKKISLADMHCEILMEKNLNSWNLFTRKISLNYLKSKLKLSLVETSLIVASTLIILIAPLLISNSLNFSISSYQENTMSVFKQLNPNFKRLINPKAQIDDMTRDAPLQTSASTQNLKALSYIEKLADESIEMINIDLIKESVTAKVNNLPAYKLTLLKDLMEAQSVEVNLDGLREGPNGFFGNLVIYYDAK